MNKALIISLFFVGCYTTPPCETDIDCPSGSRCTSAGLCYTNPRDVEVEDVTRDSFTPDIVMRCFNDEDCGAGLTCLDNGTCAENNRHCETFWQCKMDEYCTENNKCSTLPTCTFPGDCPDNTHCTSEGICAPGQTCVSHWDCPNDFICTGNFFCYPSPMCYTDWDCPTGTWCTGGNCKRN